MRFINKIIFVFKECFQGLFRNTYKTCIQLVVSFISLCLLSIFLSFYYNVQNIAKDIDKKIQVKIFLKDDIENEQIDAIKDKVASNNNIVNSVYVSKDDSKNKAAAILKNSPYILDAAKDMKNPYPAYFVLDLRNGDKAKSVADSFQGMSGIENGGVDYGKEYIDRMLDTINFFRNASLSVITFLFIVSVFLMTSIINFSLSTKKDEYHIMDMLGASKIQIKAPFYFQGIILGGVSSLAAFFVCKFLYSYILAKISIVSKIFSILSFPEMQAPMFKYIILTGIATGFLATYISLTRFVRVSKAEKPKKHVKTLNIPKSSINS